MPTLGEPLLLGPFDRENPAEPGRVPSRRVVADRLVVAVKHRQSVWSEGVDLSTEWELDQP